MTRIGIVTGLAFEAAILRRHAAGSETVASEIAGADAARAYESAQRLIKRDVAGLMSFGIAGGLDGGLAPGDLVLPENIVQISGEKIATDADWRARLAALAGVRCRVVFTDIAGSDRALGEPSAKFSLFASSGGGAVDMESHAVARAAVEAGVPFVAIRAIADPAWRGVPGWITSACAPDGRVRPIAVAARLMVRPCEIGNVLMLARDTRAATATLRRVALLVAPGFGLV